MMDWKPEALNAALSATTDECPEGLQYVIIRGLSAMKFNHPSVESVDLIYSALDAAINAQGEIYTREDMGAAIRLAKSHARAEAFEETAAFFEVRCGYLWSGVAVAEHIRALAKERRDDPIHDPSRRDRD